MMDRLAAMRTFAKVADSGGFSAAARALGCAKAVVSRQVAQLEAALGVQLLVRTTRQVRLTESGRRYYERCAQLLADLDDLDASVQQHETAPRGLLRVAAPQTFSELHLAGAVFEFTRRYPDLRLELVLTDRVVDLVEQGFDVAVRIGELPDSSLLARRLASVGVITCAAPAYLARHGTPASPDDLSGHALVQDTNARLPGIWRFLRDGAPVNVRVTGQVQVNSALMVRELVLRGAGIGVSPAFVVDEDLAAGRLVRLLADYAGPTIGVYAVYPPTRHVPRRVRVFVDFLAEHFGEEDGRRESSAPRGRGAPANATSPARAR